MKRLFTAFLIALSAFIVYAQGEVLSNETILEMVELGFSDEIIISKIDECPNIFDTSIEALKVLKQNNVSETVIVSIVNASKKHKDAIAAAQRSKEGIFYVDENGTEHEILPTVISSSKWSFGAWTDKVYAYIPYPSSPNKVSSNSPKFVFYFNRTDDNSNFSSGVDNWWFKIATSPNEFVLVELDVQKDKRRLRIGESGTFDPTITSGIDNKKAVPFTINKVSDSKYEVIPQKELKEDGEYCFFYQGRMPKGGNNQSVFDFSILCDKSENAKSSNQKKKKRHQESVQDDIYD